MEPVGASATRANRVRVDWVGLGGYWLRLGLICKDRNGTNSHLAPVGSEGGKDRLLSTYYVPGMFFLTGLPTTIWNF